MAQKICADLIPQIKKPKASTETAEYKCGLTGMLNVSEVVLTLVGVGGMTGIIYHSKARDTPSRRAAIRETSGRFRASTDLVFPVCSAPLSLVGRCQGQR